MKNRTPEVRPQILIVDDNPLDLKLLEAVLSPKYGVRRATGGAEALGIIESDGPPDLILLDVMMPGIGGLEVLKAVRKKHTLLELPVIMISAKNETDDVLKALNLGANDYITKPIDLPVALARTQTQLQMKELQEGRKPAPEAARPEVKDSGAHGAFGTAPGEARPLFILLVDDDSPNRLLIKAYLKNTPHRVEEAENGRIALEKFQSGHYDLVLMDMQMPAMDGLTATREIRKWERSKNRDATPIIALTAHAISELSSQAGCDALLTKPIGKETLLKTLREYEGKPRRR